MKGIKSMIMSLYFLSLAGCRSVNDQSMYYPETYAANNETMNLIKKINLDNGAVVATQVAEASTAAELSAVKADEATAIITDEKQQSIDELKKYHTDIIRIVQEQKGQIKEAVENNNGLSRDIGNFVLGVVNEKFAVMSQQIKERDEKYDIKHGERFNRIDTAVINMAMMAKTASEKTDKLQAGFLEYKKIMSDSFENATVQIKALQDINAEMKNEQSKIFKDLNKKLEESQELTKLLLKTIAIAIVGFIVLFGFKKFLL